MMMMICTGLEKYAHPLAMGELLETGEQYISSFCQNVWASGFY
jgi:hypothetical protein